MNKTAIIAIKIIFKLIKLKTKMLMKFIVILLKIIT